MTVPLPGHHGGDARIVAAALGLDPSQVLDLSMSLNPFAPDPTPLIERHLSGGVIGRYPDAVDRATATDALAEALAVDPGRVLVTNGGAEAIALVAAELGRGRVDEPEFSLYARHLGSVDGTGPRFRSDPHNPTGRLAAPTEGAEVWDEAFFPLATGRWRGTDRDASIVLGSLTKVLACPGLRIGYLVAPDDGGAALGVPELIERLKVRQPAWAVGPLALAVMPELLDSCDLERWTTAIAGARGELVAVLHRFGYAPLPSDANFVLVPGAPGLRAALAQHGVVVRDCASFGLADHVRIAVPGPEGLAKLEAALERSEAVAPS